MLLTTVLDDVDARSVLAALDELAASGGCSPGPGDLLSVVIHVDEPRLVDDVVAAVDRMLIRHPESQHGPERLDGSSEHALADNALVDGLHGRALPAHPLDLALVRPLLVRLEGSGASIAVRQVVTYFEPAQHRGFRLHGLPPLTLLVFVTADARVDVPRITHLLDVLHRGRGRVFRDEYAWQVGRDGLPNHWMDDDLRDAVELTADARNFIVHGGHSPQIGDVFAAAVAANARLAEQELELDQRASGARWKLTIHTDDLRHLVEQRWLEEEASIALLAPCRHYVQQLEECRDRVHALSTRAGNLFALISAMADRALLDKTEGARQAAVVVGVLTALLATVGIFAGLAAIPLEEARTLNPILRIGAIVGALVTGAALLGLLLARAALRREESQPPEVVVRLSRRPNVVTAHRRLDLPMGALAAALFLLGAAIPNVVVVVVGLLFVVAAVTLHARRSTF